MGWKVVENPSATSKASVPADGVLVSNRAAMKGSRYIVLKFGAEVARRCGFTHEKQACAVMVGTGPEAGKVAVATDTSAGKFIAKKVKGGIYQVTISARAAEGLFKLDFPAFARTVAIIPAGVGNPVTFTFGVDDAMLAG